MKVKRIFIILGIILLMTLIAPTAFAIVPTEVDCPDEALNHALHDALGTAYSEPLLDTQLMMLSGMLNLSGLGIKDITGLEYLIGIDTFVLSNNDIDDLTISFCSMVANHTVDRLHVSDNNLNSIPSELETSSLKYLDLSMNKFYSLPLSVTKMSDLMWFNFSGNRTSNLPHELASMTNLRTLIIEANRIKKLPTSFTGMELDYFMCDYNFIDVTYGSDDRAILMSMIVHTEMFYEKQLPRLEGLTVEYPDTGMAKFSWDAGEDITFSDGFFAKLNRITILQDGTYIDNITPDVLEYEIADLVVGQEYEFSFSFDYNIMDTRYEDQYTRTYTLIDVTPVEVVEATLAPTSEPTPAPTFELTPSEEPEQEPTEIVETTNDTEGQEVAIPTSNTFAAITIILFGVIGILILALIVIIILYVKKKKS